MSREPHDSTAEAMWRFSLRRNQELLDAFQKARSEDQRSVIRHAIQRQLRDECGTIMEFEVQRRKAIRERERAGKVADPFRSRAAGRR